MTCTVEIRAVHAFCVERISIHMYKVNLFLQDRVTHAVEIRAVHASSVDRVSIRMCGVNLSLHFYNESLLSPGLLSLHERA